MVMAAPEALMVPVASTVVDDEAKAGSVPV
jgi:hypothetical protein